MKTIREILEENTFYYSGLVFDDVDQALKELEEVLLKSLPKKRSGDVATNPSISLGFNIGYNQALEDTRKAIKELMR
jgi:hypothetical protein